MQALASSHWECFHHASQTDLCGDTTESFISILSSLSNAWHTVGARKGFVQLVLEQRPLSQHTGKMRQLKGKPKKETSKDKKERKQAMQEARQQITTVVLPTLAVVVLLIVVFVYVATRPTITE
ncbi:hypothetical protein H8959_002215 [Pygathrix nigripes]